MASQETDSAEQGTAPEAGSPGSRAEPEEVNASTYQPIDEPLKYQMETQALGAVQILTGVLVLALGAVLGMLQYLSNLRHAFFFTFYTGYPFWGAVFYISSGSITVAAGSKPTKTLVQNAFGINISSATIALTGIVFLSLNLAVNIKSLQGCQSSQSKDLCISMGSSSTGLVCLMLILTLLELCITMYIIIMWFKVNCCESRQETFSLPYSVEKGMPSDGNK
ncbi:membrane-spanning 4-domains subfamily A member 3 [Sorex fumeus]|uniref:membrane-spanning 4-domains subfamily A member 3 n=1 Tax=Sorex fumeus TaxID=62283 RepID=UPI0024AE2619|nr:membrane-spanning 4-domains subfamily A member 3 [Sorex fumeus]